MIGWLIARVGKAFLVTVIEWGGGALVLLVAGFSFVHSHDAKIEKKTTENIEQATNHAAQIGKSAAAKSQRNSSGGVRVGIRDATPNDK